MSMRLSHEEREILWSALYDFIENNHAYNEGNEKMARHLQQRLEKFDKLSFANGVGGRVAQEQRRSDDRMKDSFLKGMTGKGFQEWMQATDKPAPAKSEEQGETTK